MVFEDDLTKIKDIEQNFAEYMSVKPPKPPKFMTKEEREKAFLLLWQWLNYKDR